MANKIGALTEQRSLHAGAGTFLDFDFFGGCRAEKGGAALGFVPDYPARKAPFSPSSSGQALRWRVVLVRPPQPLKLLKQTAFFAMRIEQGS
jgi:hypothetical protein